MTIKWTYGIMEAEKVTITIATSNDSPQSRTVYSVVKQYHDFCPCFQKFRGERPNYAAVRREEPLLVNFH